MNYTIAVIVYLGYFLSPVWSIGLNENQLKVMIGLYADLKVPNKEISEQKIIEVMTESFESKQPTKVFEYDSNLKVPDNKDAEQKIIEVMTESFGIEQPNTVYKYDSSETTYVNLHNLMMTLSKKDKNSDEFKVKKLTPYEVDHYLNEFIEHPEFEEQLGHLTLQQLSEILQYLKLYGSSKAKLEEHKSKIGDDNAINEAEFLLIVLDVTPEGDGLTLEKIKNFVDLYKVHETVSGNIDLSACQKVFEDIDITSKQDDLNLLLNSKRPFAKVLMDLMIIAAECSQTVEENESLVFSPGEVVIRISVFNSYDQNLDGLLTDEEYDSYVYQLKAVLFIMEEHVKDSLTFEKAQDFLKKSDGPDCIEGKKVLNFAEFLESQLVIIPNIFEEDELEEKEEEEKEVEDFYLVESA